MSMVYLSVEDGLTYDVHSPPLSPILFHIHVPIYTLSLHRAPVKVP